MNFFSFQYFTSHSNKANFDVWEWILRSSMILLFLDETDSAKDVCVETLINEVYFFT